MNIRIKVGCCGFPVDRERYFKKFSVIEIQSTFYDFVKLETLKKWREEAPESFEFIIKVPQFITHQSTSPTYKKARNLGNLNLEHLGNFQPSKEVFDCYKKVCEYAEILNTKVLIFQSPPSFKPEKKNIKNMAQFFKKIERRDFILGWEARGVWQPEQIKEVCMKHGLIDVVDTFIRDSVSGGIFYFRLHGGKGYRKIFSDVELKNLYKKARNKTGYIMFNNITMFEDAQRFKRLLSF